MIFIFAAYLNKVRQNEDRDFLINVLENKMELDLDTITVNKLVRLGRREISEEGSVTSRPLRFSVEVFEHKRQILKANSLL